ncbi:MAG: Hsp20/alpha crystallin family protein [Bacteroidia bacterium]|nr:Hsp20/alpha crystallin family protein [Bacteroidia bacterium]
MTLIKWNNPLKGLGRQNQILPSFENLFNDYFNADFSLREFVSRVPAVNVSEKEDKYLIEVSAPGFNKDEFKVEIADGILTISGEHKEEKKEDDKNFSRKEFNCDSFRRSFNLADSVDEEQIGAKYKNGILYIQLPKIKSGKLKHIKEIKIE